MTGSRLEVEVEDLEVIQQEVARAMHAIQKLKVHSLPILVFDKIDSPFCLQNCSFLLAAHFAQILPSKYSQSLATSCLVFVWL